MGRRKNPVSAGLIFFPLVFAFGFGQDRPPNDNFIFKTAVHVDLLLHLLAHLDIGKDDASLYSEDYIKSINKEKQKLGLKPDLKDQLNAIKDVFVTDSGLRYIDFLPFYVGDYEELLRGMRWLAMETQETARNQVLNRFKARYFTTPKQRDFIRAFAAILDLEYQTFYRDYWQKEQERLAAVKGEFEEFVTQNGRKLLSAVMKKEKKGAVVFFCLSMTRWGRGFSSRDRLGAAVKFPETREEFLSNFFWAVHEMSHQFIDALVMKAENMDSAQSNTAEGSEGYKIHLASESGVVYADYLLFQKYLPEHLKDYLAFFWEGPEKEAREKSMKELLEAFKSWAKLSDRAIAAVTDYLNAL